MNNTQNPWDIIGKRNFNTHLGENEIDPRAADNILIAWPSILKLITQEFPNPKGIKALDFGCGTGGFCNKLNQLGFDVTGIDLSEEMIKIAEQNSSEIIQYISGDQSNLHSFNSFNIVTSVMVFQFIKDIGSVFLSLSNLLFRNGILVFAVFNPEWVKTCLGDNLYFSDFDSNKISKNGRITFSDIKIPVHIRDSGEYHDLAN